MKYRADIDGLRAIAVLPVLLFHAHFTGFSGGFVGVDVFFVVSGFLITGILARQVDAEKFSIATFYERRFKRLMPAFAVVTLFSMLASTLVVSPEEIRRLGAQVVASSVFLSNLYFYLTIDYFAASAENNILLHSWSLAVEEQFYLLFPILLLVIGSRPTIRFRAVLSIAIGSFVLAQYCSISKPDFNFYLLPTRAWELMVGSLLALHTPKWLRHPAIGAIGLAAIALSVVVLDRATPFPGVFALPAVLGTAAVISSGGQGPVSRALSWKPLVHIGQISYSLYLWHWPILLLVGKLAGAGLEPSASARVLALLLSFPAAHLSWRFVEQTTRHVSTSRTWVFGAAGAWTVIAVACGVAYRTAPETFSTWNADASRYLVESRRCFTSAAEKIRKCDIGDSDSSPKVFFWGDSHGNALLPAIQRNALEEGWTARKFFLHGCPPLLDVDRRGSTKCRDSNAIVLQQIVSDDAIETVVLMGRWGLNYDGYRPEEPSSPRRIVDLRGEAQSQSEAFELGIIRTVTALKDAGKSVLIVTGTPEFDAEVAYSLGLSTHLGTTRGPALSRAAFRVRNQKPNALFRRLVGQKNLIDAGSKLCGRHETCPIVNALGQPLYEDSDHLAPAGAEMVAPAFAKRFRSKKRPRQRP